MPHFLLTGSFGAGNTGDECLLAGFLTLLPPDISAHITTANPSATADIIGPAPAGQESHHYLTPFPAGIRSLYHALRTGTLKKTLHSLRTAHALILPGGGLFTDQESLHAIIIHAIPLFLAHHYHIPIHLYGQTIGPFHSSLARRIAATALHYADSISVRDSASIDHLLALGIPEERITLGKDSALLLATPRRIRPLPKKGEKRLVVSLRDFPNAPKHFFPDLARLLDHLIDKEWTITLIPFETPIDNTAHALLLRSMRHAKKVTQKTLTGTAQERIAHLSTYHACIAGRLHAGILAHLAGLPVIAITYAEKVSGVLSQLPHTTLYSPDHLKHLHTDPLFA